MARNFKFVGVVVLICTVVTYVMTPRPHSSLPMASNKILDRFNRIVTENLRKEPDITSNWTPVENIVLSERDRLRNGKDRATIANRSYVDDKREIGTGRLVTAVGHVASSKDSMNESSSEIAANNNLSRIQGHEISFREQRHIAFLKVHKAASTTLQIMFFRFGFERNLSFVLPVKEHYFSKSVKTHEDIVQPRYGDHYDIICNHGVFSHKIYSEIMPNDTVYLAVVRKPFEQFVSAVNYYTHLFQFQYLVNIPGDRMENLIRHPEKYDQPLSYTMNAMARDFGFKKHHFFNESNTQAKQYLEKLDNIFDFVLVAEYFDESLILMKRLLNWSLKDILYIAKNVRGPSVEINDSLMKVFRKRNKLDYLVYDFFYEKFKLALNKSGKSVLAETENFRRVLSIVQHWCDGQGLGEVMIDASKWNEQFVLNKQDCQLMRKGEIDFINLLRG